MTKKPAAAADQLADPTSDEVVLWFLPDARSARNVAAPARDLTRADVARLAYVEAARRGNADGVRPDRNAPDQAIAKELIELLLSSGRYSTTQPAPAEEPTAPADPAPTPEG